MKTFKINKEKSSDRIKQLLKGSLIIVSAFVVGLLCGAIGGSFARSISFVTELRNAHPWLIYLLPFGGLVSVGLYKLTKNEGIGTDRALESAQGSKKVPLLLIPVIFIASVITHLFGGSAGKEGAALQLGSGAAEIISKGVRADRKMRSVLTICGMAALFSAVFGTPVGACVFALEVAVIGRINAVAVFPAFVSSITAHFISLLIGTHPERFHIESVPEFGLTSLIKTFCIGVIVSLTAYCFCHLLHGAEKFAERFFKNSFIRIFVGGCIIIVLTLIFGTDYNGGGIFVIERIFEEGTVRPEAFLLKIIFTVITVSAGYKGGEIVPSFFIGSTLGAAISFFFGLPIDFGAAVGMISFFGGVTNCPIASAVLAVELFGTDGFVLFAAAAFSSRVFSGKISLYHKQKAKELKI